MQVAISTFGDCKVGAEGAGKTREKLAHLRSLLAQKFLRLQTSPTQPHQPASFNSHGTHNGALSHCLQFPHARHQGSWNSELLVLLGTTRHDNVLDENNNDDQDLESRITISKPFPLI